MSKATEVDLGSEKGLLVVREDGSHHLVVMSALAMWAELLGIEDPAEVLELMLEALEHPIQYADTDGTDNEWTALYAAYEADLLGNAVPGALAAERRALRARLIGDTTTSRRRKPKKLDERGLTGEKVRAAVDARRLGGHRKAFRETLTPQAPTATQE